MKKYMAYVVLALNILCFNIASAEESNTNDSLNAVKLIYGRGYTSSLQNILIDWTSEKDIDSTSFVGVSYERFIKRETNYDLGIQGSIFKFDDKGYGSNPYELNAGIKGTWKKFPWSKYVGTKLYVVEGISYVNEIPYMERKNLEFENKPTSKFLNYLEFGFSVDLKDVTTVNFLDGTYLGIGISHRSGVFGLYNGVKGGSNYVTYFLEKEF